MTSLNNNDLILNLIQGLQKIRKIVDKQRLTQANLSTLQTDYESNRNLILPDHTNSIEKLEESSTIINNKSINHQTGTNETVALISPKQNNTTNSNNYQNGFQKIPKKLSPSKVNSFKRSLTTKVNKEIIHDESHKCCRKTHKKFNCDDQGRSISNLPISKVDKLISKAKESQIKLVEKEKSKLTIKFCRINSRFYDSDVIRAYIHEKKSKKEIQKMEEKCHDKCQRSETEIKEIRKFMKKKRLESLAKSKQSSPLADAKKQLQRHSPSPSRKKKPSSLSMNQSITSDNDLEKLVQTTDDKPRQFLQSSSSWTRINSIEPDDTKSTKKSTQHKDNLNKHNKQQVQQTNSDIVEKQFKKSVFIRKSRENSLNANLSSEMKDILKSIIESVTKMSIDSECCENSHDNQNLVSERASENKLSEKIVDNYSDKLELPVNINETFVKLDSNLSSPLSSITSSRASSPIPLNHEIKADYENKADENFSKEHGINGKEFVRGILTNTMNKVQMDQLLAYILQNSENNTIEGDDAAVLSTIIEESMEASDKSKKSVEQCHLLINKPTEANNEIIVSQKQDNSIETSTLISQELFSSLSTTKNSPSPISLPLPLIGLIDKSDPQQSANQGSKDDHLNSVSSVSASHSLNDSISSRLDSIDTQIIANNLSTPSPSTSSLNIIEQFEMPTSNSSKKFKVVHCKLPQSSKNKHDYQIDDSVDNLSSLPSDDESLSHDIQMNFFELILPNLTGLEKNLVAMLVKDIASTILDCLSKDSDLQSISISRQPDYPEEVYNLQCILLDLCRDIVEEKFLTNNLNELVNMPNIFEQFSDYLIREVTKFLGV